MKKKVMKRLEPIGFVLLALIFTIGLMFASVEIPRAVDGLLSQNIDFLDVATGQNELTDYKTELFLSRYHIRFIGYACLGLVVILIAVGFILEKRGLASAGAVLLFLPVFGHFAATMFFLGGLGFLRFLWLPFLDISFDIMHLGDAFLLPYHWILKAASLLGLNLSEKLPYIITGLGIFIFLFGVLAWIYGRIRNQNVADFWIYRFSRHPQYLGWIIWSYGVLFLPGPNMKQYTYVANSFPWLLTTMIIITVALLEERKMKQKFGKDYDSYRQKAPLLFPLPRIIRKLFSFPVRLLFKTEYPDRKREIAAVVGFYTAVFILLSAFTSGMLAFDTNKTASMPEVEKLVHTIKTAQNRNDIRNSAISLADAGEAGEESLIDLLEHKNVFVRWYCADALGRVRSETVVQPLAALLDDPDHNVRKAAAGSLGSTNSKQAVPILMDAFLDPGKDLASVAARSLGRLDAKEAVPLLIEGLKSQEAGVMRASAWALGEINDPRAIQPLITCLDRDGDQHQFLVGDALRKLGSEQAVDAFIAGMKNGAWWIQSSCAEALGKMKNGRGLHPLIEALREGEVRLRRAAVLALANYPDHQIESALKEALEDEDWEVRLYAEAILNDIQKNDD